MFRFLLLRTPLILIGAILVSGSSVFAQCPQIEAIMVDACGTEAVNEFVVINSGGGFNTADIQLSYDLNNNIMVQQNNDINIDINNLAGNPTPCGLMPGNTGAYTGCSNLISVGPGVDIPANSIVVLQTSASSANGLYNFTSLCGAGQCVYVIASGCTRTAGGFTNGPAAGTRTTIFQIAGGCTQTITYNLALSTGGNGAYYLPQTNTYGNAGCVVPPTSPAGSGSAVNQPPNITVCAEDAVNVPFTGTATSYDWTNNNVNIGLPASGTGDLDFTAASVATVQVATITVTPSGGSCPGTPKTFTITVRPLPNVNPPADVTVCAGAVVNVPFTGTAGATYAWTNDNPAVGLGASGNGNINFTSANVATQQVANITVTPTLSGCPGNPQTFTVTVNPKPQVDDPPNITVCANEQVMVPFTGTATTYNWSNNNVAIGLGASGSGDLDFTANNVLSTQVGTITVTPNDAGCPGPAQTFTITVSPAPTMNQRPNITVCGGATVTANFSGGGAGAIYNWINDNPAIGLADMGMGNLNFVSANPGSQEVATITVAAQVGTCQGPARTFTITINPTPVVDDPGDQSVCAGDLVSVSFTGTANNYNWTNNNTAIGLAASGSNDILFVAANVATNQTGTITVTPVNPGCPGTPVTFQISVAPVPNVNQPANITVCAGATVTANFTGTAGATFDWTNNNPLIGLGLGGSGNISFVSANVLSQEIATITVTPDNGSCPGNPKTFTITVNPAPMVNDPADEQICAGEPLSVVFSGTGVTYNWTNNNIAIGLPASGTGNLNFTGANVATPQTATITVTPNAPGCPGVPQTFTITVTPLPTLTQPANITVCANAPINVNFAGTAGATFNWTNSNTAIGLAASGMGNINTTSAIVATQQVATITVTPTIGTCMGTPLSFTITVIPAPAVDPVGDLSACAGQTVFANFTGTAGATFSWTNSNPAIGLGASGTGDINFPSANVASIQTGTITVTPASGACPGIPGTFNITINPVPVLTQPANQTFCGSSAANIMFTATAGTILTWTNSNPAIGLGASGTGDISFTTAAVTMPEVATITVTPTLGSCPGIPKTFTITIVTAPTVANPGNIATCGNQPLNVPFSGLPGTTYTWTNDNPAIGLPASGSGDLNFTTANVMTLQTAQITVTPQIGVCTGTPETFTITVNLPPSVSISGSPVLCAGDTTILTATGGGTYVWESSEMTPSITVAPDSTTTYTVTVSNAAGCTSEASFTVTVIDSIPPQTILLTSCNPADTGVVVQVLSGQFGCDSLVTTITTLLPKDSVNLTQFTCNPANAGTFTQVLTNQFGCDSTVVTTIIFNAGAIDSTLVMASTCDPAQAGTTQMLLTGSDGCDSLVITVTSLFPKDSINITKFTCNPNNAGILTEMLTNQFGCDSIVVTTTIFDSTAIHSTFLSNTTCDPAQVGTTQMLFSGSDGCDSLVITTTTLLPNDSTNITQTSCHPGDAGVFTQMLSNQFGCDSIIITTVVYDPALIDTTQLTATTCDPSQAGSTQMILSGSNGCDSIVIMTTTLLPADTTNLTQTTCDPNNAGTFTQTLSNQSGCDSTIITMVVFDPALLDTTQLTAMTCDPSQVGVTQMVFNGSDGCDSLVITTTSLSPSNTTNLTDVTCDPNAAGTFTQTLTNQFGCDSTVITTVIFDPSLLDFTQVTATTCDPNQVGVTQMIFNGSDGCDSTVVTTTTLSPSNTTNLSTTTCHPNDAGVFTDVLVNQFGCDSTVITTVVFDPALIDTTQVNSSTCDPTQVGTSFQVLPGLDGCDSVIVTTVVYDANLCAVVAELTPAGVSCAGSTDGTVSITVSGGQAPFQYNWTDGAGNTGSGQIAALNTPAQISGVAPGNFAVTITQSSTGPAATLNTIVPEPLPVIAQAIAVPAFNSFSISCPGASDGSADGSASGGTGPYQYSWSSGATGTPATGLAEGDYTLTVTDQNNCTALANVNLSAPPPLDFSLQVARPDCGALVADATFSPSGGVAPYTLAVDGNVAAGTTTAIGSGTHLIEITDNNGCIADSSIVVDIQSSPLITLPADTFVYLGESLTIEALTNLSVWKSLSWQPAPDTSCLNCLLQTWMPVENALYTVTIVDTFGCDAKASIKVIVRREKDLYVPNVFSPDGNGVNDLFQINGGPSVRTIENLRIFDRWGNAVYIWDDPIEPNLWPGWDGTVGGKKVALGVYVYYLKVLRVNGETEIISGDITVAKQ